MANFTHFNQDGEAIMVDVSQKDITMRIAIAEGSIKVNQEVFRSIKEQTNKKGDVLAVARIAGIMAAKKTSDMIPLCHPLFITKVTIDFELDEDNYMIKAIALLREIAVSQLFDQVLLQRTSARKGGLARFIVFRIVVDTALIGRSFVFPEVFLHRNLLRLLVLRSMIVFLQHDVLLDLLLDPLLELHGRQLQQFDHLNLLG